MTGVVGLSLVAGVALCCVALLRGRMPAPRLLGEREWGTSVSTGPSRWFPYGLAVVGGVAVGSPIFAVAVPLLLVSGRREMKRRRDRVAGDERADMAVGFVVAATVGLRAGRSLTGAVLDVSAESGVGSEANPLQFEVAERVLAGRPFALAVDEVLGVGSVDERLIATTIRALDATGASASAALERVAEALVERQSSREDARTQAQHALSSAGVLAALPFVFGIAAALAEPDVGRLYATTWLGAACVGTALVLIFGSWEWLQRLLAASR